ncbi:NAD-dependent epimerase/dehydratase family protein [Natronorarus salvus]|uniref:NAD-dependent epimerase/dehydratase family protein n=1 Tax=Natronorarus salvus TaxID=3117733 RepID=UPI002F25F6D1
MRVLVTGGTGFVGSELCERLKREGHDPIAFDTDPSDEPAGGDPTAVRGDVTDTAALERAIEDREVDRIAHLAAVLGSAQSSGERAAVNAGGPRSVLEAARRTGVERVALASSETVYAPDSAYVAEQVSEDSLLQPESAYAAAKLFSERLGREYEAEHDLSVVALRPTGVFGPGAGHAVEFAELFEKPTRGEAVTVSPADGAISWLSVRDAASGFAAAVGADEDDLTQPVYNLRGEYRTVSEAAEAVREVVQGAEVTVDDGPPLRWSAQHLDVSAARSDLGYEIEDGIAEIARLYVESVGRNRS